MDILKKNGYQENFICGCLKSVLIIGTWSTLWNIPTVQKKCAFSSCLPGSIIIKCWSLHINVLNCSKLPTVFKNQNKLANAFYFQDCIFKEITSGAVSELQYWPCFDRYFSHHWAQWWKKYLSKRSLIKHTCSWRDKLIVLWTLNRQAKTFLLIQYWSL